MVGSNSFFQRYIFPDGELVTISEANLIAEQSGFEVRDVENWREHYPLTLREWVSHMDKRKDEVVRLAGEDVYRTRELYMSASIYAFEVAGISINQSLLAKPANGATGLPLYHMPICIRKSCPLSSSSIYETPQQIISLISMNHQRQKRYCDKL